MTFDTVSNTVVSNNGGASVKVEFNGELRRFTTQGNSFAALVEEIAAVLNVDRAREFVIKYRDEEGDLITMSSDLELRSATTSGGVLRLLVSYKDDRVVPPLLDVPMLDAPSSISQDRSEVQPTAPPALYPRLGQPLPGAPASQSHPEGFPQPYLAPQSGFHRGGGWKHWNHGNRWGHGGWGHGGRCHKKYSKCGPGGEPPAWMQNQDALIAQIEQLGFDVKREKIFKMLCKSDGNVEEVVSMLAYKQEKKCHRKEWKCAKKCGDKCVNKCGGSEKKWGRKCGEKCASKCSGDEKCARKWGRKCCGSNAKCGNKEKCGADASPSTTDASTPTPLLGNAYQTI